MRRPTPQQQAKAAELLTRQSVAELITTYRHPQNFTWSAGRVLYRLGITNHREFPPDLRRRARKILEDLEAEGVLVRKSGWARTLDGAADIKFVAASPTAANSGEQIQQR